MRRGELNPGCVPPNLKQGTPSSMCTHEITAHFTVADMAQKCDIRKNPGCWGQDYDKNHQVIPNKIFSFNFVLNPRESIWSMLRDTVTLRRASAWSFTMQTLASFCVLTIQHMEKPTRCLTNWATLQSHPVSGELKRRDWSLLCSCRSTPTWPRSSGTTTHTPTMERWPPGRWEGFLLTCQLMFETWVIWWAVICVIIY